MVMMDIHISTRSQWRFDELGGVFLSRGVVSLLERFQRAQLQLGACERVVDFLVVARLLLVLHLVRRARRLLRNRRGVSSKIGS
jgi:hypothetical protein